MHYFGIHNYLISQAVSFITGTKCHIIYSSYGICNMSKQWHDINIGGPKLISSTKLILQGDTCTL